MTDKKFDDTDRGVLFKNDRKETEKHPDYTGSINVAGHDYWLSAWIKKGKRGKFMSLSIKIKDGKPSPNTKRVKEDMADEIPF